MTLLIAASSNPGHGSAGLLPFALIVIAVYVVSCVIWPYRSCTKCDGQGRFRSPSGKAWRYCHHCGGRGAQLRVGRRIWTYLKNTHDRGGRRR